jgi:hypothetical protein
MQGVNTDELLGYKNKEGDGDGGDGDGGDRDGEDGDEDNDSNTKSCHLKFQCKVRLDVTQQVEGNRCPGGLKRQCTMRKAWEVSTCFDLTLMTPLTAIRNPGIRWGSLTERGYQGWHHGWTHNAPFHQILCWAAKMNPERRGHPGNICWGCQLFLFISIFNLDNLFLVTTEKLFFGALHVHKEQEAKNKGLCQIRPATSVTIWDAIKTVWMNHSSVWEGKLIHISCLSSLFNIFVVGLFPMRTHPISSPTHFLLTSQRNNLRQFTWHFWHITSVCSPCPVQLSYNCITKKNPVHSVIYGNLSWIAQNASGNRGDDLWALKLAELQPGKIQHPTHDTEIFTVFRLQGEEKAGKPGMKTVNAPTTLIFSPTDFFYY